MPSGDLRYDLSFHPHHLPHDCACPDKKVVALASEVSEKLNRVAEALTKTPEEREAAILQREAKLRAREQATFEAAVTAGTSQQLASLLFHPFVEALAKTP